MSHEPPEKKKEWGAEMDYPSDEELPELPTRHETEVDVNGVKTVTTTAQTRWGQSISACGQ